MSMKLPNPFESWQVSLTSIKNDPHANQRLQCLFVLWLWTFFDVYCDGNDLQEWKQRTKFWTNWNWFLVIIYFSLGFKHLVNSKTCAACNSTQEDKQCKACREYCQFLSRLHQLLTAGAWQITIFYFGFILKEQKDTRPFFYVVSFGFHQIPLLCQNMDVKYQGKEYQKIRKTSWDIFVWIFLVPGLFPQVYLLFNFSLWYFHGEVIYKPLNYTDYKQCQTFWVVCAILTIIGTCLNWAIKKRAYEEMVVNGHSNKRAMNGVRNMFGLQR